MGVTLGCLECCAILNHVMSGFVAGILIMSTETVALQSQY